MGLYHKVQINKKTKKNKGRNEKTKFFPATPGPTALNGGHFLVMSTGPEAALMWTCCIEIGEEPSKKVLFFLV